MEYIKIEIVFLRLSKWAFVLSYSPIFSVEALEMPMTIILDII